VRNCPFCAEWLKAMPGRTLADRARDGGPAGEGVVPATAVSRTLSGDRTSALPPGDREIPAARAAHPRYHLVAAPGTGGMGTVFRAEQRLMGRAVALEVIHARVLAEGGAERFRQEIRAAARLAHPNIVTAYDAEQAGDVHFLVMEYVEGETLEHVLQ